MKRPLALTMPAVTVCSSPKGLPTASTQLPTSSFSESPILSGDRSLAPSIWIRAKSVFGSRPMTLASNSRSSASRTLIWSAFSTTWLLVAMKPSRSMINPEPRLRCLNSRPGPPSPKGSRLPNGSRLPKGFPKKCRNTGPPSFVVLTVRILTTPGCTCLASAEKLGSTIWYFVSDAAVSLASESALKPNPQTNTATSATAAPITFFLNKPFFIRWSPCQN